jgi:hypothetical protein
MIRKISRFSAFIIPPIALASLFFADWLVAFNIALGGAMSLLSFRVIGWSVRKFLGSQMAQTGIMFIAIIKMLAIFIFLAIIAYFRLLVPVPLLGGFTVVLGIIVWQGIVTAGKIPAE